MIVIRYLWIIIPVDTGHQPDADICEGAFHSRPRGEEDGAVLNQCKFKRLLSALVTHLVLQCHATADFRSTAAAGSSVKYITVRLNGSIHPKSKCASSSRLLSPTWFQWTSGFYTDLTQTTLTCKYKWFSTMLHLWEHWQSKESDSVVLLFFRVILFAPVMSLSSSLAPQYRADPGGHHHSEGGESEQLPGGNDGPENVG